jgi:hypothetical protein
LAGGAVRAPGGSKDQLLLLACTMSHHPAAPGCEWQSTCGLTACTCCSKHMLLSAMTSCCLPL